MLFLVCPPPMNAPLKFDDTCPHCGRGAREAIFDALRRISIIVPNYSPRGGTKTAHSPNERK